jgi:hypothetical protein
VHHVLADGVELFSIPDEVTSGPVTAEALEGELVLDTLMLGPPLPLWSAGNQSGNGEPDEGGTSGGEADGGELSVLSSDLAVTDLYPNHAPIGRLYLRITNNGPDALHGAPVTVTCGGTATNVISGAVTHVSDESQVTFSITLAPGETQAFPTSIYLDLDNFEYDLNCAVSASSASGFFTDPNPGNNTYAEEIGAVPPSAPSADLAVTDIFPDNLPQGEIYCRITNNGPDVVQNAVVELDTRTTSLTYNTIVDTTRTYNVTLQPGETGEFYTGLSVNTVTGESFSVRCKITSSLLDPNPGNNLYTEQIDPPNHAQSVQSDLAVTDIFPLNLPQGEVSCRITNNGPNAVQNASVYLVTRANIYSDFNLITEVELYDWLTVSLQAGETDEFNTSLKVDTSSYWYELTCTITLTQHDLDPVVSNNSYSEQIGSPNPYHTIQADLAVTDIFPDSLPNGNIFCRITNHGPDALQNVTIDLTTHRTDNPGPQQSDGGYITKQLTVTLQPGETGIFDTDWDVIASLYPIEFICDVTLSQLDPNPNNDSYSEIINTSP